MSKRKFILLLAAVFLLLILSLLSGCSSITVDGKKLKNPDKITLPRVGLYSYDDDITTRTEIEKVYSFFDGAQFVLSDKTLTEEDGNVNLKETVWIWFGEDFYAVYVAENGRAECTFGDKHYITEEGEVDYVGLNDFVKKKIQEYFDKIKAGR